MHSAQPADQITVDSLVRDVVERHPQTILVFSRHKLYCAGCHISPYHTIEDSAREGNVSIESLLHDLNRATVLEVGESKDA